MKVVIIEDEFPAAERMQRLLAKVAPDFDISEVIESVEAGLRWFAQNPRPDLIFSDIQLADGLSFDILRKIDAACPVIFTTSYDEYAIKAFKLNSIDYLLKPVKENELADAIYKFNSRVKPAASYTAKIEKLLESIQPGNKKSKSRLLVKKNDQFIPIQPEEIAYFFTTNQMTCLICHDGRNFLVDYTLEELEHQLDPAIFFRINRQFLANIQAVKGIYSYFNGKLKISLQPEQNEEVLVSREKATPFKKWLEGI
jgi:DNA-binding LytR/AlgR family response regulator